MGTSDWVALASGALGAILGGLISWLTTWALARQAAKQNAKEMGKSRGLRTLTKLSLAANETRAVVQFFDGCLKGSKPGEMKWPRVHAHPGNYEPFPIEPDDLLVFVEAKEYDLYINVIQVFQEHRTLCEGMNAYMQLRNEMTRDLPIDAIKNEIVVSDLTKIAPSNRHKMMQLESLLNSMIDSLPAQWQRASDTIATLTPALRKHLNDSSIPFMKMLDPSISTTEAN